MINAERCLRRTEEVVGSGFCFCDTQPGEEGQFDMPPRRRSITDEEIALIKGLLQRGDEKTKIQAYFTHPERPVNFGRITNIERGAYGEKNQHVLLLQVG